MYKSNSQSGNVLFLILIAVALFAALSYAVTQSTRGGGSASGETKAIDAGTHNQRIVLLRSSLQRMMISKGLSIEEVKLCDGALGECETSLCTTGTNCLFAPEGGGVDSSLFSSEDWMFFEPLSGVTMAGHGSMNLLAFMVHYDDGENFCKALQESYGLSETLEIEQTLGSAVVADGIPSLQGQWDFCYDDGDETFTSYHLFATN